MTNLSKIKKRELFDRDNNDGKANRENICLSDITDDFVSLSEDCASIELQNNKESCLRAINKTMSLEEKVKLLRMRLRDIRNEITLTRIRNKE